MTLPQQPTYTVASPDQAFGGPPYNPIVTLTTNAEHQHVVGQGGGSSSGGATVVITGDTVFYSTAEGGVQGSRTESLDIASTAQQEPSNPQLEQPDNEAAAQGQSLPDLYESILSLSTFNTTQSASDPTMLTPTTTNQNVTTSTSSSAGGTLSAAQMQEAISLQTPDSRTASVIATLRQMLNMPTDETTPQWMTNLAATIASNNRTYTEMPGLNDTNDATNVYNALAALYNSDDPNVLAQLQTLSTQIFALNQTISTNNITIPISTTPSLTPAQLTQVSELYSQYGTQNSVIATLKQLLGLSESDPTPGWLSEVAASIVTNHGLSGSLQSCDTEALQAALLALCTSGYASDPTTQSQVATLTSALSALNEGVQEEVNSTDPTRVQAALVAISGVNISNLTPAEKATVINYLTVLASALALMNNLRAEVAAADSKYLNQIAQGKLENLQHMSKMAAVSAQNQIQELQKQFDAMEDAKKKSKLMGILGPVICAVTAVISVAMTIVTFGAAAPAGVAMTAASIAMCTATAAVAALSTADQITQQVTGQGLLDRMTSSMGISDPGLAAFVKFATIALLCVASAGAAGGIASLTGTAAEEGGVAATSTVAEEAGEQQTAEATETAGAAAADGAAPEAGSGAATQTTRNLARETEAGVQQQAEATATDTEAVQQAGAAQGRSGMQGLKSASESLSRLEKGMLAGLAVQSLMQSGLINGCMYDILRACGCGQNKANMVSMYVGTAITCVGVVFAACNIGRGAATASESASSATSSATSTAGAGASSATDGSITLASLEEGASGTGGASSTGRAGADGASAPDPALNTDDDVGAPSTSTGASPGASTDELTLQQQQQDSLQLARQSAAETDPSKVDWVSVLTRIRKMAQGMQVAQGALQATQSGITAQSEQDQAAAAAANADTTQLVATTQAIIAQLNSLTPMYDASMQQIQADMQNMNSEVDGLCQTFSDIIQSDIRTLNTLTQSSFHG